MGPMDLGSAELISYSSPSGHFLSISSLSYQISQDENFSITKDGPIHKLVIIKCEEEHSGKYRFEADGRKTEAMVNVKGLTHSHQ